MLLGLNKELAHLAEEESGVVLVVHVVQVLLGVPEYHDPSMFLSTVALQWG